MQKKIILIIIDGLGLQKKTSGNAYQLANTPTLDFLLANYPNSILKASGQAVGLPKGQIGNSESGHLNIGAGRIVYTGLSLIQKAIEENIFFKNESFWKSINFALKNNHTIQLIGMLSPGGVHSLEDHLFLILELLYKNKIKHVTVHVFSDGRDVAPRSIKKSLKKLMKILTKYNYDLGSIGGRLYGMDRDQNFDKTEIAFQALQGKSKNSFINVFDYIDKQYQENKYSDEFIEVAISKKNNINFLTEGDAIIMFNFRQDRMQQLSHLIINSDKYKYKSPNQFYNIQLTTMMHYEGIDKSDVSFEAQKISDPIGKIWSQNKIKQLRIAETQKYAHVTFFFDGGKDIIYPFSQRILIDSLKMDNFKNAPQMSAKKITDQIIANLENYEVIVVNYANPDMLGHTGDLQATIKAIEILDAQLQRIWKKVKQIKGTIFLCSDHGNAEIMLDNFNAPVSSHTNSDVFFIITDSNIILENGILANVAPTILEYMKIKKPLNMLEKSLIKKIIKD